MEKLEDSNLKEKWKIATGIGLLVLIVGIGGKLYLDKTGTEIQFPLSKRDALNKDYQQGIDLIQKYVSDYLVKNYEGIEKIEWQGVGVEYRRFPNGEPSFFGDYVDTEAKVYVSKNTYFTINFQLDEEADYDDDKKKYVLLDVLNASNIDVEINGGKYDSIYGYSGGFETKKLKVTEEEKKEIEEKGIKSSKGSPNAKVTYNLKIHEYKY